MDSVAIGGPRLHHHHRLNAAAAAQLDLDNIASSLQRQQQKHHAQAPPLPPPNTLAQCPGVLNTELPVSSNPEKPKKIKSGASLSLTFANRHPRNHHHRQHHWWKVCWLYGNGGHLLDHNHLKHQQVGSSNERQNVFSTASLGRSPSDVPRQHTSFSSINSTVATLPSHFRLRQRDAAK